MKSAIKPGKMAERPRKKQCVTLAANNLLRNRNDKCLPSAVTYKMSVPVTYFSNLPKPSAEVKAFKLWEFLK